MNPVSRTAYYCCGVRAADARSSNPICGDTLAERFMSAEARSVFAHFDSPEFERPNTSNATRARIIDDMLRAKIAGDSSIPVFLIGAGFDTRAYRLEGGRWHEFDEAALMETKNRQLPIAECPRSLQRIAVNFGEGELAGKLAPWAGTQNALVVLEGVSEYLTQQQLTRTLQVARSVLPGHTLICDLMSEKFRLKYTSRFREELRKLGTDFQNLSHQPEETVMVAGYRMRAAVSIIGRARELGRMYVPGLLFHTALRTLRDGYRVFQFEAI